MPLSKIIDPAFFRQVRNQNFTLDPAFWPKEMGRAPTGRFDINARVVGTFENDTEVGTSWTFASSYGVRFAPDGLEVSSPKILPATDENGNTVAEIAPNQSNMKFSAKEFSTGNFERSIPADSDLSSDFVWRDSENKQTLYSPIVQGMSMASAKYSGHLTPVIQTIQAIMAVNGNNNQSVPVTGTRFEVSLNNGQVWVLYTETPVTLKWGNNLGSTPWQLETVSGDGSMSVGYDGWMRVALLSDKDAQISNDPSVYDQAKDCIPVAGTVTMSVTDDEATDNFTFQTEVLNNASPDSLLMYALPHHQAVLSGDQQRPQMTLNTVKGSMHGVVGSTWQMTRTVPDIPWLAAEQFSFLSTAQQQVINNSLANEAMDIPAPSNDTYFYGKKLAKFANLALLADQAGNYAKRDEFLKAIQDNITPWILNQIADPLVYDIDNGGIVKLSATTDPNGDFGNGVYTDHHFHYGYFIYTAAVLQKFSSDYMATPIPNTQNTYQDWFTCLLQDYANYDPNNQYFPYHRMQDAFNGHSWANGVIATGDGKNEESVSEDLNSLMAMKLYGEAAGDETVMNEGKALVARTISASQFYWQITQTSNIYSKDFASFTKYILGNAWQGKADSSVWFYPGIYNEAKLISTCFPVMALSKALCSKEWLEENYDRLKELATGDLPGELTNWRYIALQIWALVVKPEDVDLLWNTALQATANTVDDGTSVSYTQYTIAVNIQLALQNAAKNTVKQESQEQKAPAELQDTAAEKNSHRYSSCCFFPSAENVSRVARDVATEAGSMLIQAKNSISGLGRQLENWVNSEPEAEKPSVNSNTHYSGRRP